MIVKELIKLLQEQENQDAEVFISEGGHSWELSLYILKDPSNPDDAEEISFQKE